MIDRDWPNRAHSRMVEAGGIHWHVQQMGDGPVVLMLHGTGGATHSWRDFAPLLAKQFTVVAPDLPGHGFSGRSPGAMTLPGVARSVAALLEAMDVSPDVILGHSAGTAIAIRMALDGLADPDRIVGLNAALLPFPGLASRLFPSMARMLFVNPLAPHLFAAMAGSPRDTGRFLERSMGSPIDRTGVTLYNRLFRRPAHVAAAIAMMAEWDLETLRADLPRLAVPLHLFHGERDPAIPIASAREAAGLVERVTLHPLPGLGHLAHEEQPERVAEAVLAVLSSADG